jgi:ATP-dependent DNA helicase RecQ
LLSAVSRLNERFGINYVVDFLRGSSTTRTEHQHLKTFGVGKDISKEQWKLYVRELLRLQYLKQSEGEYPVLQLTEASHQILKGELPVMLVKSVTVRKEAPSNTQVANRANADLFTILKAVRYQLAKEENVAAFQVFSDATLMEMATYLPLTMSDLANISGFGNLKLVKYGSLFLDPIIDYCQANQLTTKMGSKAPRRQRTLSIANKLTDTKRISLQLFRQGKDMDEIAAERELKRSTIEEHLGHFVFSGEIGIHEIVNRDKLAAITRAIEENKNSLAISPVKQKLGDGYSYGEITAVMNYLRRMNEG